MSFSSLHRASARSARAARIALRLSALVPPIVAGCNGPAAQTHNVHSAPAREVAPLLVSQAAKPRASVPFVSFNVPNLHYIEDDWRFTSILRYRLPNEFEIHDALQSVALMGGSVVRLYTLSVRKPTDTQEIVRHVLGPGQFNEEAFVALDRVLASAAELGIQVIVPFVDNWSYWGGVDEYATFRGKVRDAFFSDEQVIADFERTIDHVVLRTNTINGRAYGADPTIYGWETGNELVAPDAWVARIAKYIKSRDTRHAVIDGTYGPFVRETALEDPNVDVVSSHHYDTVRRTLSAIDANVHLIAGRKRYFIGEFGLLSAADTERVLRHALVRPIEGILLWSLRFHNRDGGYYHHLEKAPFQSYHFPGSLLGHDYEEQPVMQLMRHYAFGTRHQEVPVLPVPAAPSLLPVSSLGEVRWRGSVGARYYVVERQIELGIWEIVGSRVDESQFPYKVGFVDATAPVGKDVRYRVVAANETGLSDPSLPSEEVRIAGRLMFDEMVKPQHLKRLEGPADFTTQHPELCKMDPDRLRAKAPARAVYPVHGHAVSLRIYAFAQEPGAVFELSWSSNGHEFTKLPQNEQVISGAVDEPVVMRPVLVSSSSIPKAASEIAIKWLQPAEIGRVELQTVP